MNFEFRTWLAVHKKSDEKFVRRSDGRMDDLGPDEFISLVIEEKNVSPGEQWLQRPYIRIDGWLDMQWASYSLAADASLHCHVYWGVMQKLSPGPHRFEYIISGKSVYSGYFHLIRPWKKLMPYPLQVLINEANGKVRSPFIGFRPRFENVTGITEYAIDFWIDDVDRGTYFSTMNFYMDVSSLEKKYASVSNDYTTPGAAYCGFQIHGDGKLAMIMTVWDVICRDEAGRKTVISAKQLYPEGSADANRGIAEGSHRQRIREYPWKTRHAYRMLMQRTDSPETGNTVLTMFVCDLENMRWDKLVAFDIGYKSKFINAWSISAFMENYEIDYAGSVRSVSMANIRGRDEKTGNWVAAKNGCFTVNSYVPALVGAHAVPRGSYRFGSDDASFWIITSGVEGLCAPPEKTEFSVVNTATDSPY